MHSQGTVYIASFQRGSKWPQMQINGKPVKRINVTSGSNNKINGEKASQISPMYLGPVNQTLLAKLGIHNTDNESDLALIFENYWQYGKIFDTMGHLIDGQITTKWMEFRKKGYAERKGFRHPKGTKTKKCKHMACSSYYFGEYMDYITSRKKVYCPIYEALAKETAFYKLLKKQVENGLNVIILDFDGPKPAGTCLPINVDLLKQKINDPTTPFGHGYVFAAMLGGIQLSKYCVDI